MKTESWVIIILLSLILGILVYGLFTNRNEKIDYATMRKIQQEVLAEQLKKIPRDTTTIINNTIIKEKTKYQLNEFELADSTKRDSLLWFYYLNWKNE